MYQATFLFKLFALVLNYRANTTIWQHCVLKATLRHAHGSKEVKCKADEAKQNCAA